jgi:hypothetical protein
MGPRTKSGARAVDPDEMADGDDREADARPPRGGRADSGQLLDNGIFR